MHIIIAGGTGLIGRRLVDYWLSKDHQITIISRSKIPTTNPFPASVGVVTWKELSPDILSSSNLVINLAGASIGEKRWSAERKQEILDSRIDITRQLATAMAGLGEFAPPLMNASAIGIYGLQKSESDRLPPSLSEDMAGKDNITDFLSEVGHQWEQATKPFITAGGRVIFLRFGVVLAKEGGALPQMLTPFRFGLGGPIGSGNQPFSWVAIDDVVRAIDFLKDMPDASGPYNIVAPQCVRQNDFAKAVGHVLHRPSFFPLPAFFVKLIFGQMGEELLLSGQHVVSARLKEKGFTFKYPTIDQALSHLLSE